ncbi:glycosyltransferase [Lachnospiraceae bacterium 50-23]|jgi:glycosyltransferase involved in cell wall biosynthesis|nr:glycosyltransferase [Dorea sp.]
MPILSVIIPAYNIENYIKKSLDSVCVQNVSDIEIIVIDDGSVDRTGYICDEYAKDYSNLRVYHKENSGLAGTRNFGIQMAEGKYIAFLDGDDFFAPHAIENILCVIKNNDDVDVVIGRYINYYMSNGKYKTCAYHLDKQVIENSRQEELFWELFRGKTYDWYACLNIVKKSYIIENKIFFKEGICFEDALWTPEILFCANKTAYIDIPFYIYLQGRPGSITVLISEKTYRDKLYVCQFAKDFCRRHSMSDALKKRFMGNYNHIYVSLLADSWKFEKQKRNKYWQEIEKDRKILLYSERRYQYYLYKLWKVIGIRGVSYILHARAEWVRRKMLSGR